MKAARVTSSQSIIRGFAKFHRGNFYDQCQLFVSAVEVHGALGDTTFVNTLEKYMLFAISQKEKWENSEEVVMLTEVYTTILKVRYLNSSWLTSNE